ncbi:MULTISPECIES: homogentisate 1,2-dioxygenase [unclassified Sphingomonas]|jgi:hypothetical protein|uniref:homogentisate 1,2-dioxygenase n=1 Tax=unclassified Sphingomonas TaxID=196159 RepID=UPI0018E58339|nr:MULTISPECIES: homogentisate 1,2-dioxygenase [unclassified Sphingomonas]
MMSVLASVALMLSAAQAGAPATGHEAHSCPETPVAPPADLAGWVRPVPLVAGRDAAHAPTLAPGQAVTATLSPVATVTTAAASARTAKPAEQGGLFAVSVSAAGRYRIAAGSAAWIDVAADGRPLTSVAHSHGPACSGIRKMVDFDLSPGRYLIQVTGDAATLPLMIVRLPG